MTRTTSSSVSIARTPTSWAWNGVPGDGENFAVLATGNTPDVGNFLTYVDSDGNALAHGGAAYVADFGFPGVAQVTAVPEASSLVLAIAACALSESLSANVAFALRSKLSLKEWRH
ncbi:MAG: hypothetical protein U1D30_09570 [Planctomycetota bacterium]